jgi:hypothetical protein
VFSSELAPMTAQKLDTENIQAVGRVRQTQLLLQKNGLVKLRDWRTTISEILLPLVFCFFLVLIRNAVDIDDIEVRPTAHITPPPLSPPRTTPHQY